MPQGQGEWVSGSSVGEGRVRVAGCVQTNVGAFGFSLSLVVHWERRARPQRPAGIT